MNFRKGERIFLAFGLTLLAIWAGARFYGSVASHAAIHRFQASAAAASGTGKSAPRREGSVPDSAVDFTLWNPKGVVAYKESLSAKTDLPIAILRFPRINLEVPVFNDTDDLTLNRGVGLILGTAQIGQPGNLGIAGHRDGFFRGLMDVGRDDSGHAPQRYIVMGSLQISSRPDKSVNKNSISTGKKTNNKEKQDEVN